MIWTVSLSWIIFFFPWTESAQERLMERSWKSIGQGRRCGAFSSPLSTLGSGNP